MPSVLIVVGTRPEAIKLIPLYKALIKKGFATRLCATFQHNQLLAQVLDLFQVTPDFNLNIMQPGQSLEYITSAILNGITKIFKEYRPDIVLVQGDTTTALASSLAAFYQKISIGHVEAGLRTDAPQEPFPEEMNRRLISRLATYHFAPTQHNVNNLMEEKVPAAAIFCTGNTVVDGLQWVIEQINVKKLSINHELEQTVAALESTYKKIIVLTTHRRESFGQGLNNIFEGITQFALHHKECLIIYPVHPNPAISLAIEQSHINHIPNILCIDPLAYHEMVFLMTKAHLIITDSGGIQEEAVSLGKRVLILRNQTERPEGIYAGLAQLVGTDKDAISDALEECYTNPQPEAPALVYGSGDACEKIVFELSKLILTTSLSHRVVLNTEVTTHKTTVT